MKAIRILTLVFCVVLATCLLGTAAFAYLEQGDLPDDAVGGDPAEHLSDSWSDGEYESFSPVVPFEKNLLIALAVGLLIGLLVAFSLKSQLKSVSFRRNATGYVKNGSFRLTRDKDLFLYRTHTRIYSPQQKSSGGSRGGRGRF